MNTLATAFTNASRSRFTVYSVKSTRRTPSYNASSSSNALLATSSSTKLSTTAFIIASKSLTYARSL